MKQYVAASFLAVVLCAAVLIGCQSMYEGAPTPTPTPAGSAGSLPPDGYFVEGGNNVPGGGPPPPPVADEEDGEATQSNFRAIQIDPAQEDTAGPKFLAVADLNDDGLLDVISGHNQSQAVQIHLQQPPADTSGLPTFQTVNIAGTLPVSVLGGLKVADIDQDGGLDVVIAVKHTGMTAQCLDGEPNEDLFTGEIIILYSPFPNGDVTDGDQWMQVQLQDSHPLYTKRWGGPTEEDRAIDFPEAGGYTGLAVGDIDLDGFPDIIAAANTEERDCGMQLNAVEVWLNPGNAQSPRHANLSLARDGIHLDKAADGPATVSSRDDLNFWYPSFVMGTYPLLIGDGQNLDPILNDGQVIEQADGTAIIVDVAQIRGLDLYDVDEDGDLDIVTIWGNSQTQNVRWLSNPLLESGADALVEGFFVNTLGLTADSSGVPTPFDESIGMMNSTWQRRPIGTVDGMIGDLALGDLDGDGHLDVFVRDSGRNTAIWFRHPTATSPNGPVFPGGDADSNGDPSAIPDRFDFPWSAYVMDFYSQFRPNGIAAGPLTLGTSTDVAVAVGGAMYWYNNPTDDPVTDESAEPLTAFGTWSRDFVLDDSKLNGTTDDPTDLDYVGDGTLINDMLIVDLDGDGLNDIIATFDRRVDGGLHDDSVIWFRNTLGDQP